MVSERLIGEKNPGSKMEGEAVLLSSNTNGTNKNAKVVIPGIPQAQGA
jgi:hypothetical protein